MLVEDKSSADATNETAELEHMVATAAAAASNSALAPRRTRSGRAVGCAASTRPAEAPTKSAKESMRAMESLGEDGSKACAVLQLLQ